MDHVVVHAIRGKREKYKPIKSVLSNSIDPIDIAFKFKSDGFKEVYVADLDAIMDKGDNLVILEKIITKTNLSLIVDAGTINAQRIQELLKIKVQKVIIGTEKLLDLNFVKQAIAEFGNEKIILSIDLADGKILCRSEEISSMDLLKFIDKLEDAGVQETIILDLKKVGSKEGPDLSLLNKIRNRTKCRVLVGGGIRNTDEVVMLKKGGIEGVLLSTALHTGTISADTLRTSELL